MTTKPRSNRRYEQTLCDKCNEPLHRGDPGIIFLVHDIVGYDFEQAWVALHDEECRLAWFIEHRIKRWEIDTVIEDVI